MPELIAGEKQVNVCMYSFIYRSNYYVPPVNFTFYGALLRLVSNISGVIAGYLRDCLVITWNSEDAKSRFVMWE